MEKAYQYLFIGAMMILAILIILCFVRAILGPDISDRIVSINMIGTMTIIILAVLSIYLKEEYLLDVSIIYAMISFLAVVVLTKVYMGVYLEYKQKQKKETEREESNIK